MKMRFIYLMLLIAAICAGQQTDPQSAPIKPPVQQTLSGPRFGVTLITGALVDSLKMEYEDARPLITQFGWQFERRFMATEEGLAGLAELVILVGGIEQEIFVPSLSFLVGLRTVSGKEFGLGPSISPLGVAYAFAAGVTKRYGGLNFPINFSIVSSRGGLRFSLLFGFNMVTK